MKTTDITHKKKLDTIKEHFGEKDILTRSDAAQYIENGGNIPTRFYVDARINRGEFSIQKAFDVFQLSLDDVSATPSKNKTYETPKIDLKTDHGMIDNFCMDEYIPQIDKNYIPWGNYSTVKNLVSSNKFFTLYITGDSGSGKNVMIEQAAAESKRPLVRISCTSETTEEHLVGSKTLLNGNVMFEEAPVIWCAINGGILLLDEISAMSAANSMCLQNVLEGKPFFVKSANKLIVPHPSFCVIATDNTKGRGSDSGRYIGTNILNDAFLERFQMTMVQGYPSEKIEKQIIQKRMQQNNVVNDEFVEKLVRYVQAVRKTYVADGIEEQITTRRACHIVDVYAMLNDVSLSVELCIQRFDASTVAALLSLWQKMESV